MFSLTALLAIAIAGQLTTMVNGPVLLLPWFRSWAELTVAAFTTSPQANVVVAAVSVMFRVAMGPSAPKLQVKVVPPATGEAGKQAPALGPPMVQLRLAGNVSVSTTSFEVPVPLAVTVRL